MEVWYMYVCMYWKKKKDKSIFKILIIKSTIISTLFLKKWNKSYKTFICYNNNVIKYSDDINIYTCTLNAINFTFFIFYLFFNIYNYIRSNIFRVLHRWITSWERNRRLKKWELLFFFSIVPSYSLTLAIICLYGYLYLNY